MSGKAHPIVYVLTVLVTLNLAATFWLAFTTQQHANIESAGGHELPTTISSSARDQLLEDFRTHYNNRNYDAIFDGLDESAKIQIDREDLDNALESLQKTGEILQRVHFLIINS